MATQTESLLVKLDANISGYTSKMAQADAATEKLGMRTAATDKNVSKFGRSSGMAGIQIQQFVGQIQGGQSAMLALSQQSADLGFVLGAPLLGAVVGISASIVGMLLPSLFSADENIKSLTENTEALTKTFRKLSKEQQVIVVGGLQQKLKDQAKEFGDLTGQVDELTAAYKRAKFLETQGGLSIFADSQETLKELTAAQVAVTKLGVELEATAGKIREFSKEDEIATETVNSLIVAIQEHLNLMGASARAIDLSKAATMGANSEQLNKINLIHDEIDAEKERQAVLAESNALANVGQTMADPELLGGNLLNEQRLRDEQQFLEDIAEIKFTGLETEQELFEMQQEMHRAMLANKLISEEEFAKAQGKIAKDYSKGLKTEEKDTKSTEVSKLNTRQSAIRAGMAANEMFFNDNKAIAAGLIIADTAAGIQKSLAINPYDYVNVGIIAATGAMNLANALGSSKGGGSTSSGVSGGGGSSQSSQQNFERDTSSLDFTDSTAGGSQTSTIRFATDSGDDIIDAIAGALNKGQAEGRF